MQERPTSPDGHPKDPTRRFSDRVLDYIRYRPRYPREVVPHLVEACGLEAEAAIADVGSGTGFLAERFLEHGFLVFGIEPNTEMREAGERYLRNHSRFRSRDGRAEATGLPDQSVAMIAAGQAFHWFDRDRARAEFGRILKRGGHVALIWNERRTGDDPFGRAYEAILRTHAPEYDASSHRHLGEDEIIAFFRPVRPSVASFPNSQELDLPGLEGRLLSASYAPKPGQPRHEPMMEALRRAFAEHQIGRMVRFSYDTKVYYGRFPKA